MEAQAYSGQSDPASICIPLRPGLNCRRRRDSGMRRRMESSRVAVLIRIGTRKSTMALAQTEQIARLLSAASPELDIEIVKFETVGDQDQTSKLLNHGGKGGAFVAQIRQAVIEGK